MSFFSSFHLQFQTMKSTFAPLQSHPISPTILLMAITLFIILCLHSSKKSKRLNLPPGPKPWPIVGNLPKMLAHRSVFRWIQEIMDDLDTEIACIKLGNICVIPVISPSISREILIKQDSIFASRPTNWSSEHVSLGYLSTAMTPFGDQWKKMKRIIINELVSPLRLQWLHDKRVEEADNLVRYVYNQCNCNHGLVDLRLAGQQYCGNVIRRLFFNKRYFGNGSEDGGPGAEELEHVEALLNVLKYLFAFSVSDYLPWLRRFDLDGHKKAMKKATNTLRKYHDPIIDGRIQQWRNGTKTQEDDWLDVLIALRDANNNPLLTVDEIKAQIIEVMTAAIDNPYNNVEWVLSELLNQPELFQKTIEELDNVVGRNRLVQESDIPKLNFIKACVREGYRLHPIVDFNIPHVSMEDTIVGNYFIPKGSHVLIRRQGIGRNPRVCEEPLKFKPERHFKEDGSNLTLSDSNLELITFSTGRRSCPGTNLGSTMTVMLFARLVQGFTWTKPPNDSIIDLSECEGGTTKAKPLVALGKPRLPLELYCMNKEN